jgi:predicted enzyme related to lactoylglutathione lyase
MPRIVWWEIETPAPEAFQRFHGQLWGWSFEPAFADTALGADYWIIHSDGEGIGGVQRAATGVRPQAGTRVYVEVDDLEAALARVRELGGRVERSRTFLGGDDRWFATAVDPTGVSFGMWTARPAGGIGAARPAGGVAAEGAA